MTEFSPQLLLMAQGLYEAAGSPGQPDWSTLTEQQQKPWITAAQKAWGITSANNIAG